MLLRFILSLLLTVSLLAWSGCQSTPPPNTEEAQEKPDGWFYQGGKPTGLDPRAREIEKRLGFD